MCGPHICDSIAIIRPEIRKDFDQTIISCIETKELRIRNVSDKAMVERRREQRERP